MIADLSRFANSSLTRNFAWMLAGQGLGYGLRIIYFIVIARLLGVLQYGIVVGAYGLVNLVAQYGRLGTSTVLLRYVAPDHKRFAAYWGHLLMVTSAMGGLLTIVLRVVAPHVLDPASAAVIALTAVGTCLCEQLTIGATQAFQAFENMRITALLNQMTSLLRTLAAVGMLLVMHHASAWQWALSSMIVSGIATVVAVAAVTAKLGWPQFSLHLFSKHGSEGLEYAFASSTTNAYDDLDKTMLSHYGMSAANGIYGMAYRIIEMATVPIASMQLAAEPRLYQLAGAGTHSARALGRRLLVHCLLVSAALAVCMFVFAPLIPLLAGKEFTEGISALRWLSIIPVFRSVHRITGSVLTCTGSQRYKTLTQLTAAFLNFLLNLWLIPRYGWHGAAWASLATDGALGIMNWSVLEWLSMKLTKAESLRDLAARRVAAPLPAAPLVSIIIPYYEQPAFIAEAVKSAKVQTHPNVEIIVVDDGSPIPLTSHLTETRGIKLLRIENQGVSAARNVGFQYSAGQYLVFLDSDDVLFPDAIEANLQALSAHPEAGLSFGAIQRIDETGRQLGQSHVCRLRDDYFCMFLEGNPIGCPGAAMIRRDTFVAAGLFDESLRVCEDYDLYLKIARHTPLTRNTSCVVAYRQHKNSISQSKEAMLFGTMAVLDKMENLLTEPERKKLRYGRRRWRHLFRRKSTLGYFMWNLYFRFRSMLSVPLRAYFRPQS